MPKCGIGFIKTSLEGYFLVFYDNTHESLDDITKYVHDRLNLKALRKLDHIGLTRGKQVSEFDMHLKVFLNNMLMHVNACQCFSFICFN